MPVHKRKHFLTNKKYQFRYTVYILLGMVAVAGVVTALTFSLVYPILSSKLSKAVTETISHDLARGLLFSYWISVAVLVLIAAVLGILFSHRVVGPLNRLAVLIKEIKNGNISKRIILREKDEFIPLANAINGLLDSFAEFVRTSRENMDFLDEELGKIRDVLKSKNLLTADIEEKLAEISEKREGILTELSKYKT
ncbi:MAG: methyl-accepting chemotaxis protein [bacterium]